MGCNKCGCHSNPCCCAGGIPFSMMGPMGPQGPSGIQGNPGTNGTNGLPGTNGTNGTNGTDGGPFAFQIDSGTSASPPPPGLFFQATMLVGGVGTITYSWDFANLLGLPNAFFPGYTLIAPAFVGPQNTQTIELVDTILGQALICTLRCKITDETGGPASPATNLVAYAYYTVFKAVENN